MSMKKFVEATQNKPIRKFRGLDRIPGTDKVRTFCPATHLYSKESNSLEKIRSKPERPIITKRYK